jgi:hypothetical protein
LPRRRHALSAAGVCRHAPRVPVLEHLMTLQQPDQ